MKTWVYLLLFILPPFCASAQEAEVPFFHLYELRLEGATYGAADNPVRDVLLTATWRHESGSPSYTIYGFYDGNGEGGPAGHVLRCVSARPNPAAGAWSPTT